ELQIAAEFPHPESFDAFYRNIPEEWVKETVAQTGRSSVRNRRFPAKQAIWLVIGIGLMRNSSIPNVCDNLNLAFPGITNNWATLQVRAHSLRYWLLP
ncbi:transposase domain-containing protein, partial [Parendozoicomonas sp. Alg238-R29]|uniref:transposase domain-containing protein n=1 Tax=Parendozoicomonas sp. Alg238-R29 TaxID=2993446 RepID=UPI00248E82A7